MAALRGMVSLGRAVRDPRLLGAAYEWLPRQLEMFAAIEGHRTSVIVVGRQSGKTSEAAATATHDVTCRPDLDLMMASGRIRYALVACPGQEQAKEVIELCESMIRASPILRSLEWSAKADRIDFRLERERPDGSRFEARTAIRALPANSRTVRGLSASLVIFDELGHFSDAGGPSSDDRMWTALLPSTRLFGEASRIVVCSTPAGMSGKLYELHQAASGGLLPSSVAIQMATADVIEDIDPAWLEAQRVELGDDLYRQEYCAQFISGAGSFFDLDGLEFEDGPAAPGDAEWTAAFDSAFHADKFGVVLLGQNRSSPGELILGPVAAIEPVGNARSFDQRRAREDATLAEVWSLIEGYRPTRILTDQHQAPAIESYYGRLGVPVQVVNLTGPTQTRAFVALRSRLVDGSLRLWPHAALLEDLRRVRAKDSESIVLPRYGGSHCDAASALALGCLHFTERRSAPVAIATLPPQLPAWYGGW